ncbi:MAG: hypothetical protein KBT06_04385 [Prevotellaceae bacterium]|nr:hypothetical protein [Candidatus Colivivens equi]
MLKLVLEKNNETAIIGNQYPDFRGETWVLDSWNPPAHAGSTGRVNVHKPGKNIHDTAREFFPGVLGMKIVEE